MSIRKSIRRAAHVWWLSWQEQSAVRVGDLAAAASVRSEEIEIRETRNVKRKGIAL